MDVYESCPVIREKQVTLRKLTPDDLPQLLKVYSDEKAVPLFNSDNCDGDDFHYTTPERMRQAIDFWEYSYRERYFVRFTVVDNSSGEAVGTVEMFNRGRFSADELPDSSDTGEHGVLRVDLRSDHETAETLSDLLRAAETFYDAFGVKYILTKARPEAVERVSALLKAGYRPWKGLVAGKFADYYIK